MSLHKFAGWICRTVGRLCRSWNTRIVAHTKKGHETSQIIHFKVPMKRIFFSQKHRHLGAENQKIQGKFTRKVLKRNPRVSKVPNLP